MREESAMKKDIRGWLALAVFVVSCIVMGVNRLWMKNTNLTVLITLAIAAIIVWLLNSTAPGENDTKGK